MLIKDFEGLKFPDEYVIKFFFKESLDKPNASVLEMGCGNGNNLNLFYQYGYDIMGIDINGDSISKANRNFQRLRVLYKLNNLYSFIEGNITDIDKYLKDMSFDVILFPNILYYLTKNDINKVFEKTIKLNLLKPGGYIFIRNRSIKDYRYNRGDKVGENQFILATPETGEEGLVNTFFYESELVQLVERFFPFQYRYIFNIDYQNLQKSVIVSNSDMVIWGKLK